MRRVAVALELFEYEIRGRTSPSAEGRLLGGAIALQLWERHGVDAHWSQLDVALLLRGHGALAPATATGLRGFLHALIPWLWSCGCMPPSRAREMLDALQRGDPAPAPARRAAAARPAPRARPATRTLAARPPSR